MPPVETKKEEAVPFILVIRGVEHDLTLMPPLTMKDKKALLGQHQLDMRKMREFTPDDEIKFVHYVLKKTLAPKNVDVTIEDVENLSLGAVADLQNHLSNRISEVDRPLPKRSPSTGTN